MLQSLDGASLQFLDGVQLIKLQTDDPVSRDRTDQPSPGRTVSPTPAKPGNDNGHKHSSDGNDFLAVPIVAIVFTFLYLIAKTVMAPFNNRNRHAPPGSAGGGLTQEEVAVLQKIQRTLSQMESRVEALETILIEQARSEKKYGSKL